MSLSPSDSSARILRKTGNVCSKLPPLAIAFDVGGSKTKVGLVAAGGVVEHLREFPTGIRNSMPEEFLHTLLHEIHALRMEAGVNIVGIGITFLGWINEARTGPFFCMNAPALHNFNFKQLIEEEFHLPVSIHDDVTAHTLAEYYFGSGRGCGRFLCLAMGTGLGANMMVNGHPLDFTGGCAGDTGHIILRPGGPACASGCRGCAEALIGVAGIERLALEKYSSPKTAYELIRGAANGSDPTAVAVLQEIGGYTGELLASLYPIFAPERIAMTGGTSRAGEVLLQAARARFEALVGDYCRTYANLTGKQFSSASIVLGSLAGETGVIGAAADFFV